MPYQPIVIPGILKLKSFAFWGSQSKLTSIASSQQQACVAIICYSNAINEYATRITCCNMKQPVPNLSSNWNFYVRNVGRLLIVSDSNMLKIAQYMLSRAGFE